MGLVADIHARSRGTYGMLRIRAALQLEQHMVVNKKLILSIICELGIKGLPGPKTRKKKPRQRGHRGRAGEAQFHRRPPQRAVAHRHHRAPDARGQGLLRSV
jgi:hypothetical protein